MVIRNPSIDGPHKDLDQIWFDAMMGRGGDYYKVFTRFAVTTDPTVDVKQDLWEGDASLAYLATADTIDVTTTSALDTGGGTGANAILVVGLDNDYNPLQEVVTMTGLTPVTTTGQFLRIHRVLVISAGTTETNQGSIELRASGDSSLQANVLPTISNNRMSHFTVPAGYTAYFIDGVASCFRSAGSLANTKVCEIETVLRFSDGRIFPGCAFGLTSLGTSMQSMTAPYFVGWIPEKTDTKITATTGTTGTKITAFMTYILIKDTDLFNRIDLI